jgi:hypothetical protein
MTVGRHVGKRPSSHTVRRVKRALGQWETAKSECSAWGDQIHAEGRATTGQRRTTATMAGTAQQAHILDAGPLDPGMESTIDPVDAGTVRLEDRFSWSPRIAQGSLSWAKKHVGDARFGEELRLLRRVHPTLIEG